MGEAATVARDDPLTRPRPRAEYNAAEQAFSRILQARLQQLLEGKCNTLELLRRYPAQPDRLGVMVTPAGVPRDELRLPVVEELLWQTIDFVCSASAGGPISQETDPDGGLYEYQVFSTKYPHIVVERIDHYDGDGSDPIDMTWRLRRVQNQRTQTQLNRLLDTANLVWDIVRSLR